MITRYVKHQCRISKHYSSTAHTKEYEIRVLTLSSILITKKWFSGCSTSHICLHILYKCWKKNGSQIVKTKMPYRLNNTIYIHMFQLYRQHKFCMHLFELKRNAHEVEIFNKWSDQITQTMACIYPNGRSVTKSVMLRIKFNHLAWIWYFSIILFNGCSRQQ